MYSAKTKDSQLTYTMLENAFDFLLSAIDHASKSDDKKSLKYAVLHFFAGTALVLKEVLQNEHWSLLFKDVNRASYALYASGDFDGIRFKECLRYLTITRGIQ